MADPVMRDVIQNVYEARMVNLSEQLSRGTISLLDWQIQMRQELRDSFALELRAGAAGQLSVDDYLKLGPQLQSQYRFLEDFARGIKDGTVTPDAIAGRSMLYARSSGQMYWQQATGTADLPAYPKDGSTPCLSNCGCEWVDNRDGSWTWTLGKEDNCPICPQRAQDWVNYRPEAAA